MPLLLCLCLAALLALPATAGAAPTLERIGTFESPVHVTSPPDDDRLFVVEQSGVVRIVGRPEPFLDIRSITLAGGERGLLSIAFPRDYAGTGRFYAYLTAREPTGQIQIREFRRSADPGRAEPGPGRLVIAQDHARYGNHNGGQLQFGPDGLLYAGLGDGGGGNDPLDSGQRLSTLLGKLIRIDPRGDADGRYTVPADNPFVGQSGARPEIWAYGLRNPYRFSFDRSMGDLWIGDVGQNAREEVDRGRASAGGGRGADYGWVCKEGNIDTPGRVCDPGADYVPPVFDRAHSGSVCSITGGYVVRDPGLPTLVGRYLYGDYCDPELRSFPIDEPGRDAPAGLEVPELSSFGEDALGRVYATSLAGGVFRLRDPDAPPTGSGDGGGDGPGGGGSGSGGDTGGGPGGGGADRTACRIAIRRASPQRPSRRRPVRLAVTTSERCTVRATLRVPGVGRLRSRARTLDAGKRRTFKVALGGRTGARVRAALRRRSRLATLTVTARDAAGNASKLTRRVRLR